MYIKTSSIFLIPALICLIYISYFGVNIPYYDQWEFVHIIELYINGNLTLHDFTKLHNEHRLFFPRIIMFGLYFMTEYNILVELYTNWLLLAGSAFLLLYSYLSTEKQQSNKLYFVLLLLLFLAFNPQQWENLLWGWQIAIFLALLMFISTFYLLYYSTKKVNYYSFSFALITAFIGSFSFGNTLAIWGIGGITLFWLSYKQGILHTKHIKIKILLWVFAAIITLALYFYNFHITNPVHAELMNQLTYTRYFLYLLSFLGNVFSTPGFKESAVYFGVIIIIASIYSTYLFFLLKEIKAYHIISMALIIFMLMSAVVIAYGRAGFGMEQAFASRYTTFTLFGVIGNLIILFTSWYQTKKYLPIKLVVYCLAINLFFTMSYGVSAGSENKEKLENYSDSIKNYVIATDAELQAYYPVGHFVRQLSHVLYTQNLGIFSTTAYKLLLSPNYLYSLRINDHLIESTNHFTLDTQHPLKVDGWFIDTKNKQTAKKIIISSDKGTLILESNMLRHDVARQFEDPKYLYSGIKTDVDLVETQKGLHKVKIAIVDQQDTAHTLPNRWYVTLK